MSKIINVSKNNFFQARNRHNLEQSSKLAQNKELLNKRNAQVTVMDQRIGDLRERLHKKRAEVQCAKKKVWSVSFIM